MSGWGLPSSVRWPLLSLQWRAWFEDALSLQSVAMLTFQADPFTSFVGQSAYSHQHLAPPGLCVHINSEHNSCTCLQ